MELYIGNLNHIEIKDKNGNLEKVAQTCFCFYSKNNKQAMRFAKDLNLKSFGRIVGIKLKDLDF